MTNSDSTGVPTHYYRQFGNLLILCPICKCYTAEVNTAGTIYCPLHGEMWKRNGVIELVNPQHKGERLIMEELVTGKWAISYAKERYNLGVVQGKLEALRQVHAVLQHEHYQDVSWNIHFLRNADYDRLFPPLVREPA